MVVFVVAAAYAAKFGGVAIVKQRRRRLNDREEHEQEPENQNDEAPNGSLSEAAADDSNSSNITKPRRCFRRWRQRRNIPKDSTDPVESKEEEDNDKDAVDGDVSIREYLNGVVGRIKDDKGGDASKRKADTCERARDESDRFYDCIEQQGQ